MANQRCRCGKPALAQCGWYTQRGACKAWLCAECDGDRGAGPTCRAHQSNYEARLPWTKVKCWRCQRPSDIGRPSVQCCKESA